MREMNTVEFNGAEDLAPHMRMENGVIVVEHASLLGAMSTTSADGWRQIASPTPKRSLLWFGNADQALTAQVEYDPTYWGATIFDSHTAMEMATLSCPLEASLLDARP